MTQNGEEVFELDIANNIFVVGGTDILAKYRENLGL
jgi:P2 family phage contractile tail tube protein